jgi:hypothetical protein
MSPISKSVFKQFLEAFPVKKVAQKITSTERGQRLWPSQTSKNDQKYNFRADKGSTLPDGSQEIIFQANKNAENKGVKKSAQEDSHKIVAKVAIKPENGPSDITKDALKSFEENN